MDDDRLRRVRPRARPTHRRTAPPGIDIAAMIFIARVMEIGHGSISDGTRSHRPRSIFTARRMEIGRESISILRATSPRSVFTA
jgi:hypothetical protein